MIGVQGVAHPADEQRDIRALAAPVRVELVEHQEAQALRGLDQGAALFRAGEDQLQHDVVRQQDIRRIRHNAFLLFVGLLARVTLKRHRPSAVGIAQFQKLLEFAHLAIGQRVHGIDHDGLDAPAIATAQHVVDDGDNVGQALARAGASRQDVVVAALRRANGVFLVLVQPEFPANTAFGLVLVLPEDSPTLLVENTLIYESFNSAARLERRIELY